MTPDFRRTAVQVGLVCLAVGLIIAATITLTPPFDPKQSERTVSAPNHPPRPGSEAALRHAIAQVQSGVPDYDRIRAAWQERFSNLTPLQKVFVTLEGFNIPTNDEMLKEASEQKEDLKAFGPLQSITYRGAGGGGRFERYRVTFQNGSLAWFVSLGKNGALADFNFGPEGIGSPHNYINNYARFSMRQRSSRMATQLAILLIIAAFGRFVLRLRL